MKIKKNKDLIGLSAPNSELAKLFISRYKKNIIMQFIKIILMIM